MSFARSEQGPAGAILRGFFVSGLLPGVYGRVMIRRLSAVAACALLVACEGAADEPAADAAPASPGQAATTTSAPSVSSDVRAEPAMDLVGEYRLAGVDDGDINLPHGITASIGEDRIDVTSQCVEMAWSYRLDGTRIATTPIPVVSCDRGRYPEEEAIEAAFIAAREVERTANNGLRFAGGGRSVTLFSQ